MKLRSKASVINVKRARSKGRLAITGFITLAIIFSNFASLNYSPTTQAAIGDYVTASTSGKGDSTNWLNTVTSSDGTRVFASTFTGLFYSGDSGNTWSKRDVAPDTPNYVDAASSDLRKLASIYNNSLYVSPDFGDNWNIFEPESADGYWQDLYYADEGSNLVATYVSNSEYSLYTSINDGESWQKSGLNGLMIENPYEVGTLAANATLGRLTLTGSGFSYTSSDFGVNWVRHDNPDLYAYTAKASGDGATVAAQRESGGGSLYISTDYGVTWSLAYDNSDYSIYRWNALAVSDDGSSIVASGDDKIYESHNRGVSWTMHASEDGAGPGYSMSLSGDSSSLYASISGGSLYRSSDLGESWTELTVYGQRDWSDIALSADGTAALASAYYDGKLFYSTDTGSTWTQALGLPLLNTHELSISGDGNKMLAATYEGLYASSNKGQNWENILNKEINAVTVDASGQNIVASSYLETHSSRDGGVNWSTYSFSAERNVSSLQSNQDGSKVVAITYQQILVSEDYGQTWSSEHQPEFNESDNAGWSAIKISADGETLIATRSNGAANKGAVFISRDGGESWDEIEALGIQSWSTVTLSADGRKINIADDDRDSEDGGYVYASTDNGATWKRQQIADQQAWKSLSISADGNRMLAVGFGTPIYGIRFDQPTVNVTATLNSDETVLLGDTDTNNRRTITNRLPIFSGKTFPGGAVAVTVNSDPITCTTVADVDGNWSCELPQEIPLGSHTITAAMDNPENNTTEPVGPFLIAVVDESTQQPGGGDSGDGNNEGQGAVATPGAPNTGLQKFAESVSRVSEYTAYVGAVLLGIASIVALIALLKYRKS